MKCGCKNCQNFHTYTSYNYYEPTDYECMVKDDAEPLFYTTDDELDNIYTRVWEDGEEWDDDEKPICPYYIMREYEYFKNF